MADPASGDKRPAEVDGTEPDAKRAKEGDKVVYLVASGDSRLGANQKCWETQKMVEEQVTAAFATFGYTVKRAHEYNETLQHGFIDSQRMGIDVFLAIPKEAPVIAVEAVWQYSYHVLAGLRDHTGPIMTIANWSGEWPGLVGVLNMNASLTKMGKRYSTAWSLDFTDDFFLSSIETWLKEGHVEHDTSHVRDLDVSAMPAEDTNIGVQLANDILRRKAILGVFDEGCMGMYNAFFDDELLNAAGIYKERLSQSALLAEMGLVTDEEAQAVYDWLVAKGMTFVFGDNPAEHLTLDQVLEQCKMYIATTRMYDHFSLDIVGIQYQQGLKDCCVASDLAEGILNNCDRPPVYRRGTEEEIRPGEPIVHFNEVDEGAAVDALCTNRVWTALGLDPATTLHDVRWGEHYTSDDGSVDDFVWVFEISGSVPPSHLIGGYEGSSSERQPPMYFPRGGGSLKGVSKPGHVVWSRVFMMDGSLHVDIGIGHVVELPDAENERRWQSTTPQWPMMSLVLHNITRDQFMARHKANHAQVAYGDDEASALRALRVKAAMFDALGFTVHVCGDVAGL